jgi:hypothetical protein
VSVSGLSGSSVAQKGQRRRERRLPRVRRLPWRFFLGLELTPAASLFCFHLRSGEILEGFVVVHQVEADAVDAMGGVDG